MCQLSVMFLMLNVAIPSTCTFANELPSSNEISKINGPALAMPYYYYCRYYYYYFYYKCYYYYTKHIISKHGIK